MKVVKLSIRGTLLVLPRDSVVGREWMLTTLVATSLPTDMIGDAYYVDCDGKSFCVLHELINGRMQLADLSFTGPEWALLLSTARYLAVGEGLLSGIEHRASSSEQLKSSTKLLWEMLPKNGGNEVDESLEGLTIGLQKLSDSLESCREAQNIFDCLDNVSVDIDIFKCGATRTRRSYNVCGDTVLVFCSENMKTPVCEHCDVPMERQKMKRSATIQSYFDQLLPTLREPSLEMQLRLRMLR